MGKAISSGPTPRIAVLGGSKASDSVAIAENFLEKGVEKVLTGGVVANIFLIASGIDIGKPSTKFIEKQIPEYKKVINLAKNLLEKYEGRIKIPTDVALNVEGKRSGTNIDNLPQNYSLFDKIDLSLITPEWSNSYEANNAPRKVTYLSDKLLKWLLERPEKRILCVTHYNVIKNILGGVGEINNTKIFTCLLYEDCYDNSVKIDLIN